MSVFALVLAQRLTEPWCSKQCSLNSYFLWFRPLGHVYSRLIHVHERSGSKSLGYSYSAAGKSQSRGRDLESGKPRLLAFEDGDCMDPGGGQTPGTGLLYWEEAFWRKAFGGGLLRSKGGGGPQGYEA